MSIDSNNSANEYLEINPAYLTSSAGFARQPLSMAKMPDRQPGIKPIRRGVEYLENGDVELNIYRPEASEVSVSIGGYAAPIPMKKEQDGWFSLLLEKPEPVFTQLVYFADGVRFLDEKSPISGGCPNSQNILDIPDKENRDCEIRDVSHGIVSQLFFHSELTDRFHAVWVWCPPGYAITTDHYPVLYLLHGGEGNESSWVNEGKIHWICDNLLAKQEIRKMILVFPCSYVFEKNETYSGCKGFVQMHSSLGHQIVHEIIPFIDLNYRTISNKESRAIAGFSMGGIEARIIAYENPDFFDWIGAFGVHPIPDQASVMFGLDTIAKAKENPVLFNQLHQLLFFGIGRKEMKYPEVIERFSALRRRGINAELYETSGDHEWCSVRKQVAEFLKRIF